MPDRPERPLSLIEWVVLCIACEKPTYGFAIAGLFSPGGSLGRIWQVSKPAIYRGHPAAGAARSGEDNRTATFQGRSGSLDGHRDPGWPQGRQGVAAHAGGAWPRRPVGTVDQARAAGPGRGRPPRACSAGNSPPSARSPRRWPTGHSTPPESSRRWRCGGTRWCRAPSSSSTRPPGRPNWRLRPGQGWQVPVARADLARRCRRWRYRAKPLTAAAHQEGRSAVGRPL